MPPEARRLLTPREVAGTGDASEWPMGLRLTCPSVPIQVEGPVDGGYVYFRARHGEWQLAIGRDQHEAVEATIDGPWDPFCYTGDWPYAPDDHEAARAILREHLPRLRVQ